MATNFLIFLGLNTIIILIYGLFNPRLATSFLISRDLAIIGFLLVLPSLYLMSQLDPFYWMEIILFVLAITVSFFISERGITPDIWILYTLVVLGLHGLLTSEDLLTIYLFLELQALGLYILVTLPASSTWSTEAGIKYIITGALASSIFLMGALCIYGTVGQTNLEMILITTETTTLYTVGFSLLIMALIIKLGLTPFHSWIPDVYQGTSTPITTFLSTLPKLVLVLLILRLMLTLTPQWQTFFVILATLSIFLGSWAGLNQTKIRRLLAYSTIHHSGLIIFSLALLSLETIKAALIYLSIYLLNSIQTFATLLTYQNKRTSQHFPYVGQYLALTFTHPWLALCLIIGFLSLAGIPPLAGFWAKWTVYLATISHVHPILITALILITVLASYYYLRLLRQAYFALPIFYPTSLINVINGTTAPEWAVAIPLAITTLGLILLMGEPSLLYLVINKVAMTTC